MFKKWHLKISFRQETKERKWPALAEWWSSQRSSYVPTGALITWSHRCREIVVIRSSVAH